MSEIKERPILMSAPMVIACMREVDPKWQTRRIVKNVLPAGFEHPYSGVLETDCIKDRDHLPSRLDMMSKETDLCPKGVIGDRLWVRETVAIRDDVDPKKDLAKAIHYIHYRANYFGDLRDEWHGYYRWTPSIFMPRWASRITLEITDVRVQRLQDISEEDAIAEGILPSNTDLEGWRGTEKSKVRIYAVTAYRDLWESINGSGSWDLSPWVWCISFRRL